MINKLIEELEEVLPHIVYKTSSNSDININRRTPSLNFYCTVHNHNFKNSFRNILEHDCPLCSIDKKFKIKGEEFCRTLLESFPNLSITEDFIYRGANKNVTVYCKEHKDFISKTPSSFLKFGCSICNRKKIKIKRNTLTFKKELKEIFKDNLNLSFDNTIYNGRYEETTIECKEHGQITKQANSFLLGNGCIDCKNNKTITTQDFIDKLNILYPDKFTFEKTEYKNATSPITVTCKIHGDIVKNQANYFYTSGCPLCTKEALSLKFKWTTEKFKIALEDKYPNTFDFSEVEYKNSHEFIKIRCKKHGVIVKKAYHLLANGCTSCNPKSKPEQEIKDFILSLGVVEEVQSKKPSWLEGKELDIFIPEYNLAIEFNGVAFHHSSKSSNVKPFFLSSYKDKYYHFDKWKMCRDNGVRLISIYDFKWKDRKDIYKSLIKHCLHLDERVYARNTFIKPLNNKEAIKFYKDNHLEGFDGILYKNSKSFSLEDKEGKILMVCTIGDIFDQSSKSFKNKLQRICTLKGYTVVGGISKLSKFLSRNFGNFIYQTTNDTGSIVQGISDKHSLRYYWVNPSTLEYYSRNYCQRNLLEKHFNLPLKEGDTENTYMERLGFLKVYDTGLTTISF